MFALRFYRLSNGNLLITAWIMAVSTTDLGEFTIIHDPIPPLLSLHSLVCGIVITVKAFGITYYTELDKIRSLLYLNFASNTASDLSVAIALSWMFLKSRTGFRRTDNLVNTLMRYTVNTGLIVGLDALCGMVTYATMPNNFIFLAFYLLMSKLYLNSYLATLNARDELRKELEEPVSIHLSQIGTGPGHAFQSQATSYTRPTQLSSEKTSRSETVAISVNTLVEKSRDYSHPSPTAY
ncbi:hypothetical protein H0H92_006935 [Tricholoma furcatifolium]|nr:hypothetical protein H0H92_006935 [Tricholoma furcatifolium]